MSRKVTSEQRLMLEELAAMPDEAIDTDAIPEIPAEKWDIARRVGFFRPVKQPVTIRLDADVLAWFKDRTGGRGYQTEINRVLRQHVLAQDEAVDKG